MCIDLFGLSIILLINITCLSSGKINVCCRDEMCYRKTGVKLQIIFLSLATKNVVTHLLVSPLSLVSTLGKTLKLVSLCQYVVSSLPLICL